MYRANAKKKRHLEHTDNQRARAHTHIHTHTDTVPQTHFADSLIAFSFFSLSLSLIVAGNLVENTYGNNEYLGDVSATAGTVAHMVSGIRVSPGANGVTVTNNTVVRSAVWGIFIGEGGSSNTIVTRNTLVDNGVWKAASTGKLKLGLLVGGGSGHIVDENVFITLQDTRAFGMAVEDATSLTSFDGNVC